MHIDTFCKNILSNKRAYVKAWYVFCHKCEELDVTGDVSPDILARIIRNAKHNKMWQGLLQLVLWNANGNSISEANFKGIMSFKKSVRAQLLYPIEHIADLAWYQYIEINRDPGSSEVFDILLNEMCTYDCFTENDIVKMVNENAGLCIEDKLYSLEMNKPYLNDNPKYIAAVDAVNALK